MIERFGVTIDWRGANIHAVSKLAIEAEKLGYGYFWFPEAWGLESFSAISHLLTVTSRIKIGSGIVNVFSRSPATIGMACATLDQIAPNRFMLGLGTSGKAVVESFHGVKYVRAMKRTREYIEIIRKVTSGETLDYKGELLKLEHFRLFAAPASSQIPILIGAVGPKNLALAGEISDGAIVTFYPMSKVGSCVDIVNKGDATKNKKLFAYYPLFVARNDEEVGLAKSMVGRLISFYIGSLGKYYAQNLENLGYEKEVDRIREISSSQGSRAVADSLPDEFIDEFCFIGSRDKIAEKLGKIPRGVNVVFALKASNEMEARISANSLAEISRILESESSKNTL